MPMGVRKGSLLTRRARVRPASACLNQLPMTGLQAISTRSGPRPLGRTLGDRVPERLFAEAPLRHGNLSLSSFGVLPVCFGALTAAADLHGDVWTGALSYAHVPRALASFAIGVPRVPNAPSRINMNRKRFHRCCGRIANGRHRASERDQQVRLENWDAPEAASQVELGNAPSYLAALRQSISERRHIHGTRPESD